MSTGSVQSPVKLQKKWLESELLSCPAAEKKPFQGEVSTTKKIEPPKKEKSFLIRTNENASALKWHEHFNQSTASASTNATGPRTPPSCTSTIRFLGNSPASVIRRRQRGLLTCRASTQSTKPCYQKLRQRGMYGALGRDAGAMQSHGAEREDGNNRQESALALRSDFRGRVTGNDIK